MNRRINIVLPDTTLRAIDRLARPGQRSRFIDQAVQQYMSARGAESLRARLEETVLRDQDLEREVMNDWFAVDQEQWQNIDRPRRGRTHSRSGAKSTSRRSTRR